MQNSDFWIRNTSLYGSQTSPIVFCKKTTWVALELLVSLSPRAHLYFLHAKQHFWIRITSLYLSQTSPVVLWMQNSVLRSRMTLVSWSQPSSVFFFAFKTAPLASELQFSMGPSPYLWLLNAKQRLYDQNYKSLWVPDLTYVFLHSKQRL